MKPLSLRTCVVLLATVVAGCAATQRPDIRVNSAPDVDLSMYSTYGFPEETGTDRDGYSTFLTDYFKSAVREQMDRRGYRYTEGTPELLINFHANVRERTEVRTAPSASLSYGYYGYRYGLYGAWPFYENQLDSVTYPMGTVNVDVVDARRKQLIWEGIARGRISDEEMDNPRAAIAVVVGQLFSRFPGRARSADTPPS